MNAQQVPASEIILLREVRCARKNKNKGHRSLNDALISIWTCAVDSLSYYTTLNDAVIGSQFSRKCQYPSNRRTRIAQQLQEPVDVI
eukprot:GEMP01069712.1.p2 GENE.GEMP01069712.1~~GEMP01069712.1.p2  ORF type:complete len:100 (+),score=9.31 GEMP01069712.1:41-301(+)